MEWFQGRRRNNKIWNNKIRDNKNHEQAESQDLQRIVPPKSTKKGPINRWMKGSPWLVWGVILSVVSSVLFSSLYGIFRASAAKEIEDPVENNRNISWLIQNCYLLYRDLYNAQNEVSLNYEELYLEIDEGYRWVLNTEHWDDYLSGEIPDEGIPDEEITGEEITGEEIAEEERNGGRTFLSEDDYYNIVNSIASLKGSFEGLENEFAVLNSNYDYMIEDTVTGKQITNMSTGDRNRSLYEYRFYLEIIFDGLGNVTVSDNIRGEDVALVRKLANEAVRENHWMKYRVGSALDAFFQVGSLKMPRNCKVTFCISTNAWSDNMDSYYSLYSNRYSGYETMYSVYHYGPYMAGVETAYRNAGLGGIMALCMAVMFALGLFLPVLGESRPWREVKLCSLPFEVLFCAGILLFALGGEMFNLSVNVASGNMAKDITAMSVFSLSEAKFLAGCLNLLVFAAFFFGWWYLGVGARALKDMGVRGYIRQRSLIYRFFPFMKRKAVGIYESVTHMDLTKNAHKTIIKIVIINALILAGICFLWVGGITVVIVYSLILYLILRKYISDLQEKYQLLLKTTNQIADGNLNAYVEGDWGVFEPFKTQMVKIEKGFQKAVDEEVKSQRMKADLITNVSHDLKTPLTAIITYVNLLKEENITEEQRREYLDTLERKSLRLKVLIEDLFEVSKASSNNITLNIMDVDIMNLVKQVEFEMSDKLKAANLDVRMNLTDEKVILPLDSQKTYRIYENLFGNIAKYAMPGTRVYVSGFRTDNEAVITMKNISAQEITVDSSELTERFVRGDASRNTEGSGLGLAIAKSFTTIQNGELTLEVDGDLFKVTTTWHIEDGVK